MYWSYYPHRSRELVSPGCGIFLYDVVSITISKIYIYISLAGIILPVNILPVNKWLWKSRNLRRNGINGERKNIYGFWFLRQGLDITNLEIFFKHLTAQCLKFVFITDNQIYWVNIYKYVGNILRRKLTSGNICQTTLKNVLLKMLSHWFGNLKPLSETPRPKPMCF